jgi:hypothetical protein
MTIPLWLLPYEGLHSFAAIHHKSFSQSLQLCHNLRKRFFLIKALKQLLILMVNSTSFI